MEEKSRSLLTEIQFLAVLVSSVIIMGGVGIFMFTVSRSMYKDLQIRSATIADELESRLAEALERGEEAQAVLIAETFLSSRKISGIILESTPGRVLLSKSAENDASDFPKVTKSIVRNGAPLGKMTLSFSNATAVRIKHRLALFSILFVLGAFMANGLAGRYLISRRVKPFLDGLVSATRNISDGDCETKVPQTPYREINLLISHFNTMTEKIRSKNREQKEVEDALRESERKARAVLDLSFGFLGLLSPDGCVLEANRSSLDFSGVTLTEVLGKPFWEAPFWDRSTEMRDQVREATRKAAGGKWCGWRRFSALGMEGFIPLMSPSSRCWTRPDA